MAMPRPPAGSPAGVNNNPSHERGGPETNSEYDRRRAEHDRAYPGGSVPMAPWADGWQDATSRDAAQQRAANPAGTNTEGTPDGRAPFPAASELGDRQANPGNSTER